MKKITDLRVKRFRTTYTKDRYGNRIRGQEIYWAKRPVKTASGIMRFGHFFLDNLIIQIVLIIMQLGLAILANLTSDNNMNIIMEGAILIFSIIVLPCYYILTENKWGKSLGKFVTQTRVVDEYGKKPELNKIIARSFIRLVPFEALSCIGEKSRGWHDKWTDTYVITENEFNKIQELMKEQDSNNIEDHLI